MRSWPAWVRWSIVALVTILIVKLALSFPWRDTLDVLIQADLDLLAAAFVINLVSLFAKGTAWHGLLQPVAPVRWRTAQAANIVGSAMNNISVTVAGEAARVQYVVRHGGVPAAAAMASIVWARAVEGGVLVVGLLGAPFFLDLPAEVVAASRWTSIGLAALLAGLVLSRGWSGRAPSWLRGFLEALAGIGSPRRLVLPVALALLNWLTQWATYHLVLVSVGIPATPTLSCAALAAANLGGLLRLSPANVGIVQASMAFGLLPFGVPPETSVAAGLVLQGLQVPPILLMGTIVAGWKGLRGGEWTTRPSTIST